MGNARGLTCIGSSLQRAFALVNLYRISSGVDTYGEGRKPWVLYPALILLLTDGTNLTSTTGIADSLSLPMMPSAGSELTLEPFRWDQRLHTIAMHFPGSSSLLHNEEACASVKETERRFSPMCEVTAGQCHVVNTMKSLLQVMDNLCKTIPQIAVNFECLQSAKQQVEIHPQLAASFRVPLPPACRVLVTPPQVTECVWPVPENYLPEQTTAQLPARCAIPTIKFSMRDADPFDEFVANILETKCELEPSPLSAALLSHKKEVCWQVFVEGSMGKGGIGEPFGYLRASHGSGKAYLVMLPYNYPLFF